MSEKAMFKVYKISSSNHYTGISLVAANNAEEANCFIRNFKERDKNNECDSYGYDYVEEGDMIEGIYSEEDGFIYDGISYCG